MPRLLMISLLFSMAFAGVCLAAGQMADVPSRGLYLIGPEDVLEISVWKEVDLQRKVIVQPDGRISFPLVGDVLAEGRTLPELQEEITQRLMKYIPAPVVTIMLEKVAGYKIYVIGQVKNSGQFMVGQYLDVIQALALAGGLTPFAEENNIKIVRRDKNGMETVLPFAYAEVKKGAHLEQNIILKSGDVVVVP